MRILGLTICLLLGANTALADQELDIFTRDEVLRIWPVPAVRLPREDGDTSRKTDVYSLGELEADRAKNRLRLGSVVLDTAYLPGVSKLTPLCVLTTDHLRVHGAEFRETTGRNIENIQIIDAYAPREFRRFFVNFGAEKDAGILSSLFPTLSFSGEVEVEFISSDARERYFLYEDDSDFIHSKVALGPDCQSEYRAPHRGQKQYFVDNITYGTFKPRVKVRAGFFGLFATYEEAQSYYGATIYRPLSAR